MRAILNNRSLLMALNNSGKMFPGPVFPPDSAADKLTCKLNNKSSVTTCTNSKSVLMDVSQQTSHVGMHTSTGNSGTLGATNMTTLVVGLGNHSMSGTRHNIGMAVADQLCKHLESNWKKDSECHGMIAMATLDENHNLILLKPRHFMNVNGKSVLKTVTKYNIPVTNIFLLHDDIDRPLGKNSIKEGGSAGGHNGVKSVINCLGTNNMLRLRFGIDRPTNPSAVPDYVLEKFTTTEKEVLPRLVDECVQLVLKRIQGQTVK
ncbi:probable peptidyl-tRNA hydrolase [Amphiura filiformis]|uniref:probable peptidyl-tRNA hydrolase n=1 Tax=Amphiura filiformis TaxID=82378 RepID=UPI003B218EF4